jgi:hypothetical protein
MSPVAKIGGWLDAINANGLLRGDIFTWAIGERCR